MYYIGIDIGGMSIKAGIVNDNLEIINKSTIVTDRNGDYKVMARDIYNLIMKITKDSNISMDKIKSIGIGCPGSVDRDNGVIIFSNNIVMKNVPLKDEIAKYTDKPIYLCNDADCAALGEFYALDSDDINTFIVITLGTGIGSGIIYNKKLLKSFNHSGGELGHTVIVTDGEYCTCGRHGCFEAYASATALMKLTKEEGEKNPDSLVYKMIKENNNKATGRIPFEAARKNDKTGQKIVDTYVKYLSEGLINIINVFQPEVIAIGGGVSKEGENLLEPVREYVSGKTYGAGLVTPTKIVTAKLGNDAGIIGAAYLGR